MAKKKTKIEYKCYTEKGERYMICRNSEEDKSYWAWPLLKDIPRCFNWNKVGSEATGTLCYSCVNKITEQPKRKNLLNVNVKRLKQPICLIFMILKRN